jgi:zinc D-Ala-D-Ala carboxypeptidase
MKVSQHISLNEATKSQTALRRGIDNTPSEEVLNSMKIVAEKCFEPIRNHHGKAIGISSFYRSPELNKAIGGSRTSDHCRGRAIDIDADIYNNGITNAEIFHWLRENVEFDQLIWEYGTDSNPAWVHVSYRPGENRGQVLKAVRGKGYQLYA